MKTNFILKGDVWTIEGRWKCAPCHVAYSMRKHAFNDKFEFEDHIARYCHICDVELTSVEARNQHFQTQHSEEQDGETTGNAKIIHRNLL